jgi:uncharacterized protein with FMN-binding domain
MKKILLIIAILVITITAAIGINYLNQVNLYQKAVAAITFSGIDISTVPDGTYIGEHDTGFISAKVEVTVKDGVITNIVLLEHKNDRGETAEGIGQRIVEQQRIDVDAVSGATNSSRVITKAIDSALSRAG